MKYFQENKFLRGKFHVPVEYRDFENIYIYSVKKLFLVYTFGQQKRTLKQIYMNFS